VFYSAHLDADRNLDHGNWELFAKSFASDGSDPSDVLNISAEKGTDFMPAAATDAQGRAWVTWVGGRESHFHVYAAHQTEGGFSKPARVSLFQGNEWEPAIASDGKGQLAIAWDTFDKGDYDVYVAIADAEGKLSQPEAVAATLGFEVRPSVAFDGDGRLWMAYESSGDQWGKDFGALKKKGIPLYQTGRSLAVKVRDKQGQWFEPADVMDAVPSANPVPRANQARNRNRQQGRQPNRTPITAILRPPIPVWPVIAMATSGWRFAASREAIGGFRSVRCGANI
jgi:hypothetical protein